MFTAELKEIGGGLHVIGMVDGKVKYVSKKMKSTSHTYASKRKERWLWRAKKMNKMGRVW